MNNSKDGSLERRRAATLFADVANYSLMMGQDEVSTALAVRDRIRVIRELVTDYDGDLIEVSGDGVFLVFPQPMKAVSFAVEIQKRLSDLNDDLEPVRQIWFRIGINVGEILVGDEGLSGDSINVAARIESFARPGRICISGLVYEEVRTKLNFGYEYLGAQEFKNIGKSVDVFQVHDDPAGATLTPGLRQGPIPGTTDTDEPISDQSIVVLPFEFQGPDPTESWFADGMTEDITTNLSRFQEFFVIARGSASVYRDKNIAPSAVGRELGVRYVIGGTVRKNGRRLRVALQLLDAMRDQTIWGEQYDRDIEDLFDVQDEITQIIVAATAAKIRSSERERLRLKPPSDLAAYGFVLRGHNHIFRYTKNDLRQARGLYNAALTTDPRYARALSAKSRTLNLEWRYNWAEDPDTALDQALDLAQQAVEVDGSDARGFGELGYAHLYRKENDSSLAAYERALALNPNDADMMSDMADSLVHGDRTDEAIALLKKAMRLNPFYPDQYMWHLGGAYFQIEDYESAIDTIGKMHNPTEGRRILAASYGLLGREAEARQEAKAILAAHPGFTTDHWASVQPDRNSADVARFIEGLKKAGIK